ncbi:MAG: DUF4349 domain-containing protein [Alphaproteobacteria bacterium]
MRARIAGLILAALLAGCGQAGHTSDERAQRGMAQSSATDAISAQDIGAFPDKSVGEALQRIPGVDASAPSSPPQNLPGPGQQISYLAYTYGISVELPATNVAGLMDAHIKACADAGPTKCQLVSSSRNGDPASAVQGAVQIRGEPRWLRAFMGGVASQVGAAGGRITGQTTEAEDLTRDIVDTEARLRAAHTLRDRLQQLLQSHPGRLSDLLDIERELARVQGDIDSTESNLAVMRARVDMSVLNLNYASTAQSIRSDTFKPLGDAIAGFVGWLVIGFATIITAIAVLAPWALVIGLIVWGVLAWRRRRGGRFFRKKPPETPPPAANA